MSEEMLNMITNVFNGINVGFEEKISDFLYQPYLSQGDIVETIPLMLTMDDIKLTRDKLDLLPNVKYTFEYLKMVVGGACSMSMKKGK